MLPPREIDYQAGKLVGYVAAGGAVRFWLASKSFLPADRKAIVRAARMRRVRP